MSNYTTEAVQFRQWGAWHAVKNPTHNETTCCGRNSLHAEKMWRDWESSDIYPSDRCRICAKAAPLPVDRHTITENTSGAECTCGRWWSFWGSAQSQQGGTRYHDNTVPLLKASARKHAAAANAKIGDPR